jgi:hypothetical protein
MEARTSDRRRHLVYLTHHTEYHLRDGICVAVRSRRGSWLPGHVAQGKPATSMCLTDAGMTHQARAPRVGDGLCFADAEKKIVTGRVESIGRPSKTVVARYP